MKDFLIIFERLYIFYFFCCVNYFYIYVYIISICGVKNKYFVVYIFYLNFFYIINKLGVYRVFLLKILNFLVIEKYKRFLIFLVSINMLCNM